MSAHGDPYGSVTQQSPPPSPTRGPRAPWVLIGIGCLAFVIASALIAVVGGVVHLATRDSPGPTEPAGPMLVEGTGYTLEVPLAWEQVPGDEFFPGAGGDLALQGPEHRFDEAVVHDQVLVYRYDASLHAVAECRFQATFMGSDIDDTEDPEELEKGELGGEPAAHHRVQGTHGGEDAVEESWCVDVEDEVVAIYATNFGTSELSPETLAIVESVVWTGG